MGYVIYFFVIALIVGFAFYLGVRLTKTQRHSKFTRVLLDGLGILAILPTIGILFLLADVDGAGRNMTGFGAFVIYSVVTLGVVPLISFFMMVLSARAAVRTFSRSIFS